MPMKRVKELFKNKSIMYKLISLILCSGLIMFILSIAVIKMVELSYVKYVYNTKMESLNNSIGLVETNLSQIEDLTYQFITSNRVQSSVSDWLEAETELEALKMDSGRDREISEKEYQRIKTVSVLDIIKELDSSLAKNSNIVAGLYLAPDGKRYEGYGADKVVISVEKEQEILDTARAYLGDPVYIISSDNQGKQAMSGEEGGGPKSQIIIARGIKEKKNLSMRYGGTLVYAVDLERLTSSYTTDYHKLVIQDDMDSVIFSTLSEEEQKDFLNHEFGSGSDGYEIMPLGNTKYFITEIRSGKHNWRYYSISSYRRLFGILSDVDRLFIILFVMLFIPVLAVTVHLSMSLVRPISSLSQTIKTIRGNNKLADNLRGAGEDNLPETRSDEIGELHDQFYSMLQELDELIHENYEQKIYLQEAQLSALRTQLNPHFLYNTLDTIRWMATAKDYQQIPGVVKALGDILRLCMNSKRNIISLGEEIDYLRGYVAIQKIRFGDRLHFMMDVEEEFMELSIPAFSIQPLVENSINYALERMIDQCQILVAVTACDGDLYVSVEDNGPGMEPDILEKLRLGTVKATGNGIGLGNLDKRLKNLYGPEYGIRVERPEEGGARILFHVRKEKYIQACEN
ncbi:HAMP domain-containing protein [Clostridium sp. MCC353]|nr:HAMP domain-containing protein [Clostridium sp. MCC353]